MNPKFFRNGIVMLVLVIGTALLLFTWIQSSTPNQQIGYSRFLSDVQANNDPQLSIRTMDAAGWCRTAR